MRPFDALTEIETAISSYMMKRKREFGMREKEKEKRK